ncbi:MAG: beta-ketoacyl-ACP synthase II [Nitrospirae bacterium]|nr:beta-ketoacyl-ACP synthase II [Nitrospirota bacterium]
MRKVVITGIGAVTPLGNDIDSTWDNIIQRHSGIRHITKFDAAALPNRIAGELRDFLPEKYISPKDILRLDPFVHYAAAAALMACEDAGLLIQDSGVRSQETGVVIGSSRGGITSMEKALERNLREGKPFSAYLMSASTINMASAYISMRLGIKGPALGISTACASGTNAIGEAFRMIQHGDIDIALAGGAEAPVCRLAVGGYGASGALSGRNDEPDKASRPFDRDRDGFIVSEGACVLVLEERDHALKRGAVIYAELAGYGTSSDAFHQTRPDSGGEAIAMDKALKDAKVPIEEVDYINAHATSTLLGDAAEALAIKQVFGARVGDIHISSCKSMLGHMLGAAGAVEAAITALSIKRGIITPSINLEYPDPEFGLHFATSTISRDINIAISNSFGFGGVNAVLVLRKFNPD